MSTLASRSASNKSAKKSAGKSARSSGQKDRERKFAKQSSSKIADCVTATVDRFLLDLNGEEVDDLYDKVLREVEKPLIEVVLQYCEYNQSKASRVLGINRNTLRKKIECFKIKQIS